MRIVLAPERIYTALALLLCALGTHGHAAAEGQPTQPAAQVTTRLGDELAAAAKTVAPAVVTLLVESDARSARGFFGPSYGGVERGGGSGVVIRQDGVILTNHHVVERATRIEVELQDGRTALARLVGSDEAMDLAVVKVELTGLPAARFGDSDALRVGDWVVAIGAPFGLRHSVTAGIISAVDRDEIRDGVPARYLQTDATINPGNSGGPLVNTRGEVVGINTAYIGEGAGIGFSIPAAAARTAAEQLIRSGRVERGYIGLDAQPLDFDLATHFGRRVRDGALVNRVRPGGPAARAGLLPGDIVTQCDAQPLSDAFDLLRRIAAAAPGQPLALTLLRGGRDYRVRVTVERTPAHTAQPKRTASQKQGDTLLGLQLRALTPELRDEYGYRGTGAIILTGVAPGSPADRLGLHAGLALLQADMKAIVKPRDVLDTLSDHAVLLLIEDREGQTSYVLLKADP